MTIRQSFALSIAALGLACLVDITGGQIVICEGKDPVCRCPSNEQRNIDDNLFPPGKHEDALALFAQRRAQTICYCERVMECVATLASCCDESDDCYVTPHLKMSKAPKAKSCKSKGSKSNKGEKGRKLYIPLDSNTVPATTRFPVAVGRKGESPWAAPASDKAELLAADPGIWAVPGFLDDELANKFKALIDKYGNDLGHYSACSPEIPDEGICFKFTTNLAVDNKEDNEVYSQIRAKVQSLWPQFHLGEYLHAQALPKGEVGPSDYHYDGAATMCMPSTVLIYLSDGDGIGGNTIFPFAGDDGLSVTPRKGMALTWLNIHTDGHLKEKILHGVQATTPNNNGRLIATQKFLLSPEELQQVSGDGTSIA